MAQTSTLKNGVTVVWGIPDGHKQSAMGTVTNVKIANSSKEKEYPDESGECAAFVQYDAKDVLTIEILAKTSATIPARGTVLTADSVKYLVLTADKAWEQEGVQKITVTARTFANITLA